MCSANWFLFKFKPDGKLVNILERFSLYNVFFRFHHLVVKSMCFGRAGITTCQM